MVKSPEHSDIRAAAVRSVSALAFATLIGVGAGGQDYYRFPEFKPVVDVPFTFQPADMDRWHFQPDRLESWMQAVERHRPGEADAEAKRIAEWHLAELAGAVADFEAARKLIARYSALTLDTPGKSGKAEIEALALRVLKITQAELYQRNTTRILKRTIVLHTDIAAGDLIDQKRNDATSEMPLASLHFGVAMALADALGREFPGDPGVREWYVATAALLQSQRDVASAPAFVRRAVDRLPRDADLLVIAGAVHEFLASARVQDSDLAQAGGVDGSPIRKPRESLERAEKCYAQALAANPSLVEARVHRGRVLGELGKRVEAVAELTRATAAVPSEPLQYLAWLFIGDNQAEMNHVSEAEVAYRRAIALFPSAPSARFARSHTARRWNDHRTAVDALILEAASGTHDQQDPWDVYFDAGLTRQAQSLLDSLRRPHIQDGGR